jgi:cobalt/nickel transport protein
MKIKEKKGIVKLAGKPVPFAEVEVEYYNIDKKYKAPSA